MNKFRFLSIFLCFALILALFSFSSSSVSAAASDPTYDCINVLDYDYPDDYTSVRGYLTPAKPYHFFDLPFSFGIIYVDLIVQCSVSPSSVGIRSTTGNVYSLTIKDLGSGRYRCYGSLSSVINSARFGFQFITGSSGTYNITYERFDIYTIAATGTGDLGELNVTPNADTSVSTNYWYRQTSPGVPIVQDFYYFSASNQFTDYQALLSSVNWRNYDYLDFSFRIHASTISDISCYISGTDGVYRYLPFEISFLDGGVIDKNEYIGSGSTTVVPASTEWDIMMRIYIPSSYRLSGSLYIEVSGQYNSPTSRCYLFSVNGYYYTSIPSPDLVKLDHIVKAIEDSLSSSAEQNAAAESFNQSMSSTQSSVSSNNQIVASAQRPSSSEVDTVISPDAVLDTVGIGYLTTLISPITTSRIGLSILTLTFTLALIGFVFFGKRSG